MKYAFFIQMVVLSIVLVLAMTGCGSEPAAQPSIDVDATVDAQVQSTLAANQPPTLAPATPAPTVDVDATVEAAVQMTVVAQPTPTAEPTNTPVATSSPEPTPTSTPVPSPTPDPRLFWDDFESGIRPEWGAVGKSYSSVNGKLVLQDGTFESQLIGDPSWTDYRIFFDTFRYGNGYTNLQLRVQDSENYMLFESTQHGCGHEWNWYRVVGGERQLIPGTSIGTRFCQGTTDWITEVQLQGNVYRTFKDGKEVLRFVDDTYSDGGVRLRLNDNLSLEGIEILEMKE